MVTVVLFMDVSCGDGKIRKALRAVPGVDDVEVYYDTNRVVVTGNANALALKARLESKLWRDVTIVNDGVRMFEFSSEEEEEDDDDDDDDDLFELSSLSLGPSSDDDDDDHDEEEEEEEEEEDEEEEKEEEEKAAAEEEEEDDLFELSSLSLGPSDEPASSTQWYTALRIPEPWSSSPPVPDPTPYFWSNCHLFRIGDGASSSQPPEN